MNIAHNFATVVSALVIGQVATLPAAASVVNLDEFAVVRDGITIFDDSFNRNITLNAAGAPVPSGMTFSDGTPANYFLQGSIPETTANNGQAQLNTANGLLVAQPPPFIPLIQQVTAALQTGTNSTGPHALTPANTFSVIGLFDLAVPSVISGQYSLFLTNNTAIPGREIQVRLIQTDTGPALQFRWLDHATNQIKIASQVALTPAELADPQLELELVHDASNSDVTTGLYAFGSGNTLATFNGTLTALGSTDSSTDIFTSALNWAQPAFIAADPVPEPSSLAVLIAGLLGLATFRSSRK
jgi:hypothetical protein